jgi:hypothetical protein
MTDTERLIRTLTAERDEARRHRTDLLDRALAAEAEVARLHGEYLAERTARMEANGREAIPLDDGDAAAALWAAGIDVESAQFAARQLRVDGKAIVRYRIDAALGVKP